MTMDGTRTYLVGEKRVAVIDPGPELEEHINAVATEIGDGVCVGVLLTHDHPDHAAGARLLAARLHCRIMNPLDGDDVETDTGMLRALATPGHTQDHLSFWHEESRSVLCGDLMMGGMDTALVAPPEGDLQQYLNSLERLRMMQPQIIYPAHGEPIRDPEQAIDRYVHHRMQRIEQVVAALRAGPQRANDIVDRIYGADIDPSLRAYAADALEAYLLYLEQGGRVTRDGGQWSLA